MTKHGKLSFLSTLLSALGASALALAGACSSPFESCAENKVCPIESGAGAPGADTGEETTGGSTSVGTSGSTGAGTSGTGPGVSEGGSGTSGDSSAAAGSSSECPDGMSCAACESDARRCLDENTPEQCVDGNFQPQARCGAAAPFCLEGACVSCQPEDMRCSLNTLETCASDGSGWETAEVCTGDTPACLSESGECGRCTEGDTDCSGNTPQACNGEGAWEPLAPCEGETPVCASGECLACAPDATRCTDDGLEVCDADGSWESSSCPDETPVCLDDACVACEPGATACLDDSTVQQCAANGDWLSGQACSGDTPYCVGGSCNECSPGDMRCGDAVTPQLCNDAGGWESQPACGNENPACYEGDCVACTPGAKRCSQNAPQVCKEDGTAWEGSDACSGDTPACLQATGECGSCTEGDRQCDGDTPQVCDDMGVFQDQAPCGGGAPQCLPATGECAECDPAEGTGRGCANSTTPQSCSAEGQWQIEESCSGDTPVCLEPSGTCGCDSGRRCNGNTPQLCVNGTWSAQGMCSGMTPMCQEETGMCGCAEDSERCQSGVAQQCQGGTWTSLSGCAGQTVNCGGCEIGESCGGDGDCDSGHCEDGECAPEGFQDVQTLGTGNGGTFGWSMTIDGNTAIIGSHIDSELASQAGAAFVFTRNGSSWSQDQKLTADDAASSDWFGAAVDLSGSRVLIGAYGDNEGGLNNSGAAYVFRYNSSSWQQEDKLFAEDPQESHWFGATVALEGDTALIGASSDSALVDHAGAAYVFTRSGSSWTQQQKLVPSDPVNTGSFGHSVALNGDTALIGAMGDDNAGFNTGAAYIFEYNGSSWEQKQKLIANDAASNDDFGEKVALDGNTAVIAAHRDDDEGNLSGSAYVFVYNGSSWEQQQKLVASDGKADDSFGWSVGVSGDLAFISAWSETLRAPGSAYVFERNAGSWTELQKLIANDGTDLADYGYSGTIEGNTIFVGAPGEPAVYVFTR